MKSHIILARRSDGTLVPAIVSAEQPDGGVLARQLVIAEAQSFYAPPGQHFPLAEAQPTPAAPAAAPTPEPASAAAPLDASQPAAQ